MRRDDWNGEDSGSSYGGFQYRWNYDEYQKTLQRRRKKAAGRGLRAFCVTAAFVFLLSFVSFVVVLAAALSGRSEPPSEQQEADAVNRTAVYIPDRTNEAAAMPMNAETEPETDAAAAILFPPEPLETTAPLPFTGDLPGTEEVSENDREELVESPAQVQETHTDTEIQLPSEPEVPPVQSNEQTEVRQPEDTVEAVFSLEELTALPVKRSENADELDSSDNRGTEIGEKEPQEEEKSSEAFTEEPGTESVVISPDTEEETAEAPVVEAITELKEVGLPARLGITVSTVAETDAILFRIPRGVMVEYVEPDGNGAVCGLRRGDIILSVNDQTMIDEELFSAWEKTLLVGHAVCVHLFRDGEECDLSVTAEAKNKNEE